jgi:hypothetical protein
MDSKELRGLMEAYSEVYSPEQIDEEMKPLPKEKMERQSMKAYKKERSAIDRRDDPEANRQMQRRIAMQSPASRRNVLQNKKMGEEVQQIDVDEAVKGASRHDTEMRKASAAERRGGDKRLSPSKGKQNADKMERDVKYMDKLTKNNKIIVGMAHEELDIFDVVLEFLQAEGYAETLEEAEWLMANELDSEDIEEILEAEGSYGQTPKARAAMGKLAIARMRKPATEYSQKGEKTKKVKAAEKQTRRQDVLSRGLSGGKKSSRPRYSGGRGKMDADERAERRAERAFDLETSYGAGSVTKNPKKLRKQKAMGELD